MLTDHFVDSELSKKTINMLAISFAIRVIAVCSLQHTCGRNCDSRRCDIVPRLYRAITVVIWH